MQVLKMQHAGPEGAVATSVTITILEPDELVLLVAKGFIGTDTSAEGEQYSIQVTSNPEMLIAEIESYLRTKYPQMETFSIDQRDGG